MELELRLAHFYFLFFCSLLTVFRYAEYVLFLKFLLFILVVLSALPNVEQFISWALLMLDYTFITKVAKMHIHMPALPALNQVEFKMLFLRYIYIYILYIFLLLFVRLHCRCVAIAVIFVIVIAVISSRYYRLS